MTIIPLPISNRAWSKPQYAIGPQASASIPYPEEVAYQ